MHALAISGRLLPQAATRGVSSTIRLNAIIASGIPETAAIPPLGSSLGQTTKSSETSRFAPYNNSFLLSHTHQRALHGASTSTNHLGAHGDAPPPVQPLEQSPRPENGRDDGELSDHEWDIRTGRAIYIIQKTLPDFFESGLITSLDPEAKVNSGATSHTDDTEKTGVYSPHIRLAYTPVQALPAPFPRTLHVEGLPLYLASAIFLRHTLNALYTDLHVELRQVRVQGPPRSSADRPSVPQPGVITQGKSLCKIRDKRLVVDLSVTGLARVSGARGGWEIRSTYSFSPLTGLVHLHTVDSIEPAPHKAVFDALRTALAKLGLVDGGDAGLGGPVARARTDVPGPEDAEIEVLKGLLAGGGPRRS